MSTDSTRWHAIAALNREPLNRAAAALLPLDWLNPSALHVFGLALWGAENGVRVEFPGASVTDDEVLYELHALLDRDPALAMAVLEGRPDAADVFVQARDLEGVDREHGAYRVLEAIRDRLIAR